MINTPSSSFSSIIFFLPKSSFFRRKMIEESKNLNFYYVICRADGLPWPFLYNIFLIDSKRKGQALSLPVFLFFCTVWSVGTMAFFVLFCWYCSPFSKGKTAKEIFIFWRKKSSPKIEENLKDFQFLMVRINLLIYVKKNKESSWNNEENR